MGSATTVALGGPLSLHGLEVGGDPMDAFKHATAIRLQLGFTVASHANAALLSRKVSPKPGQSRQQMLELRQLDLQFAFPGSRPLREDVENQRGAIEHFAFEDLFQIAALGGRKLVIENHGVRLVRLAEGGELIGLAGSDKGGGKRSIETLRANADDVSAGGGCETSELLQGILKLPFRMRLEFDSYKEGALRFLIRGCY